MITDARGYDFPVRICLALLFIHYGVLAVAHGLKGNWGPTDSGKPTSIANLIHCAPAGQTAGAGGMKGAGRSIHPGRSKNRSRRRGSQRVPDGERSERS